MGLVNRIQFNLVTYAVHIVPNFSCELQSDNLKFSTPVDWMNASRNAFHFLKIFLFEPLGTRFSLKLWGSLEN